MTLSNLTEGSGGGDSKTARTSKNDSPSSRATNKEGRIAANRRFRSVLLHPLGLPLFKVMHGEDPQDLPYFDLDVDCSLQDQQTTTITDNLFENAYNDWVKTTKPTEPKLPKHLTRLTAKVAEQLVQLKSNCRKITAFNEVRTVEKDERDGHIDVLLTSANGKKDAQESTPHSVIEFGLNGQDWWSKFHHNSLYVDRMCSETKQAPILAFQKPVLMATVTVDTNQERLKEKELSPKPEIEVRMGVFLCTRKEDSKNYPVSDVSNFTRGISFDSRSVTVVR